MVLALIPVLAAASPPDPAWIGGIYDAADGDEIVTLIDDQAGSHGVAGYAICQPLPLPQALHEMESCTAQGFSKQRLIRGPPSGSCTRIAAPPLRCAGPRQPALHSPTSDCAAGGEKRMSYPGPRLLVGVIVLASPAVLEKIPHDVNPLGVNAAHQRTKPYPSNFYKTASGATPSNIPELAQAEMF